VAIFFLRLFRSSWLDLVRGHIQKEVPPVELEPYSLFAGQEREPVKRQPLPGGSRPASGVNALRRRSVSNNGTLVR
jgi:hypothetical protein